MSGFVYIWYDRKHKRYYVGSHWGNEDDGYVCSSSWMKQAYRRRPEDFKRRILERVVEKKELLQREGKWLSLIKNKELKTRYYNLSNHEPGHWFTVSDTRPIRQKISDARQKQVFSEEVIRRRAETLKRAWAEGRMTGFRGMTHSDEYKTRLRQKRK